MKFAADFRLAVASLKSAKARSVMTVIAVIIGVLAYVLVTAFIDGFEKTVTNEINDLGGNLVTANPCDLDKRDASGKLVEFDFVKSALCPIRLSQADLDALQGIDGVITAAPLMLLEAKAKITRTDEELSSSLLVSTNGQYPEAFNQKTDLGRFFSDDEVGNKVVVGYKIAEDQFNGKGLGSQITIRGERYSVIGVMEEYATGTMGPVDLNLALFIPLKAGKAINNGVLGFSEIDIQLKADVDADEYVAKAHEALLKNYGGEDSFSVVTQAESLEVFGNILGYAKTASQVIAYIMLAVGGTVIALIMLIVVRERTREIGIRKSIGATNQNIMSQFLVEALLLSWFGSIIGITLAYLIGLYIGTTSDIKPSYTMASLVSVLVISTLVGTISGIFPAGRAARKDPVEALRSE